MKSEYKVSVIVPMHNAQKHLGECLDSIIAQTLKEIEILCINDGSTDRTEAIVREYMQKDSRVSVINQENQYAGVARNNGIRHSKGEYLVFWDADDIFEASALEDMYLKMETDQADICVCDAVRFRDGVDGILTDVRYLKERFLPETVPFSIQDIPQYIFNFTTDVPWNKMYRKEFIVRHNLEFEGCIRGNDHYFVLMAFGLAESITLVKKHLIRYRISSGISLTSNITETPLCIYHALSHAKESLEQFGILADPQVVKSFANRAVSSLVYGIEKQDTQAAFLKVYQTLKESGFEYLFVNRLKEEDFYTIGGYRKYRTLMLSEPMEYLLSECVKQSEEIVELKRRHEELRGERNEARYKKKQLEKELNYIKERKWYKMAVSLADVKNKAIRKGKNSYKSKSAGNPSATGPEDPGAQ